VGGNTRKIEVTVLLFTDHDDLMHGNGEGYSFRAQNDHTNQRLWVFDYWAENYTAFADHLSRHARNKGFSKIIIPAREGEAAALTATGFANEAQAEGFFRGRTACFLTRYLQPERRESPLLTKELEALAEIQKQPRKASSKLDSDFELRTATAEDIPEMARLFGAVFSSYPTPVDDPEYLALVMRLGTLFQVATTGGRIVGVAAAETDRTQQHAEMTDCATHPDCRGQGLASHLLITLEKACVEHGYRCLYSLSRAGSFGMNLVLHRLGYQHGGTLINNAHIGGRFENFHLWVKYPAG
jgi:putative beta-lysine N-acetyltransferase